MKPSTGTLYSTGGDETWPVEYEVETGRAGALIGINKFPEGTRLRTLNPAQPVYLRVEDGRWARVYLPVEPFAGEIYYRIAEGSAFIDAPPWAPESRQ